MGGFKLTDEMDEVGETESINKKDGTMSILPTTKSIPETSLKKYLLLIYGRPKIGKTTLAAQFEDPLFLCFEPGAKSLSLFKKDITSWKKFREIVDALCAEQRFKTVVIDTLAPAYAACLRYVAKEHGVDHPSEVKWGKGWDALETEFNTQLNRISGTGRGIVLLSHSDDKDIEQWDGTTKTMIAPDLPKQAMRFVDRSVDLLAYYYYGKNEKRWLRIQGTDEIMAGNRIENHFEGVSRFEAGTSAKLAYQNLIAAFENRLGGSTNGKGHNTRLFLKR